MLEGWLNYAPPSPPNKLVWRQRYVILKEEENAMLTFKSEYDESKSMEPVEYILLNKCRVELPPPDGVAKNLFVVLRITDTLDSLDKAVDKKKKKSGLSKSIKKLVKSNSKLPEFPLIHRFTAETEEILIKWVNGISHVCALAYSNNSDDSAGEATLNHGNSDDSNGIIDAPNIIPIVEQKREEPEIIEPEVNEKDEKMKELLRLQREKERKEREAAIKLQSFWRLIRTRLIFKFKLKKSKATKIQSFWRMVRARIQYKENLEKRRAIILISSSIRGYQIRKAYLPERKEYRYRVNVMREMVSTEKTYLEGLKTLIKTFLNPLKDSKLIGEPQVKSIFSNMESLIGLHEYLASELESRIQESFIPPFETIGNCFTFLLPQFKLYVEYINNYDSAIRLLARLQDSNSKFSKFIQKAHENPELNTKTIEAFLIMPVQRLPRIEMLLKDLLKHTKESHPDYEDLQQAFTGISELTAFVNERKREEENIDKMAKVQRKMGKKGSGHQIVQPHRKWLKEGNLEMVNPEKKKLQLLPRSVILFSDLLLCSTEKSVVAIKKGLHHTVRYDTLETYQLDLNSSAKLIDDVSFLVQTKVACCTLYAENASEAKEWVDAINLAVTNLGKPRSHSSSTSLLPDLSGLSRNQPSKLAQSQGAANLMVPNQWAT